MTYASSIFLRLKGWDDGVSKAAWILGSVGTLGFDAFILGQYLWYSRGLRGARYAALPTDE